MHTLIKLLNEMKAKGIISDYAIGGATALVYYLEPIETQDIDVFVVLTDTHGTLVNLVPIYAFLEAANVKAEGEYLVIGGAPVQFLVPYNELVQEAVATAHGVRFHDEEVRLPPLEYLMAIMVQTGRPKDRARLADIFQSPSLYDNQIFLEIIRKFDLSEKLERTKQWIENP
jgi:hypothetical protein